MTVLTLERVIPDEYGDPQAVAARTVHGCHLAPASSEDAAGRTRAGSVEALTLFAPAGTEINADDRAVIGAGPYAGTWRVDGEPAHWESPFNGRRPGVSAVLRRATG